MGARLMGPAGVTPRGLSPEEWEAAQLFEQQREAFLHLLKLRNVRLEDAAEAFSERGKVRFESERAWACAQQS